ncbi:MAG: hypothetical protein JSV19_00205 [Phycisphaerales bacterium]|nr:MAG: hypothetical protein JSV19_00205 [Phycisphaerales bacterium]
MIRKALIVILTTLAVATVLLWWGHSGGDKPLKKVEWSGENRSLYLATNRGGLYVNYLAYTVSAVSPKETWIIDSPQDWPIPARVRLLSKYSTSDRRGHPELRSLHHVFFGSPVGNVWFLTVLFSIYPAIAFIRRPLRRYRRRRKGLCAKCGYNLTGNVSGICPECGEPTADRSSSDTD